MSRRRRTWPTPSSTSGLGGSPASAADSVSTRLQKLWKFETVIRERVAGPTASSSRAWSSFAALTLYVRTRICSGTSAPSKGRSRSGIVGGGVVPVASRAARGSSVGGPRRLRGRCRLDGRRRLRRQEPPVRIERALALRVEQPPHPLDDDPRLARPRPRNDDERPIPVLDDPPLLWREADG